MGIHFGAWSRWYHSFKNAKSRFVSFFFHCLFFLGKGGVGRLRFFSFRLRCGFIRIVVPWPGPITLVVIASGGLHSRNQGSLHARAFHLPLSRHVLQGPQPLSASALHCPAHFKPNSQIVAQYYTIVKHFIGSRAALHPPGSLVYSIHQSVASYL